VLNIIFDFIKINIFHFFNLDNPNDEIKKYYLVMEYADGGSLRNYLKTNFQSLTWENKCNLAYQLACAVSCLHGEGIVHRDLVIYSIII
jgi:serine/threonine protein kinase